MEHCDKELEKILVLGKFSLLFGQKEWARARMLFYFIQMDYPDEADKILKKMTKNERSLIEL